MKKMTFKRVNKGCTNLETYISELVYPDKQLPNKSYITEKEIVTIKNLLSSFSKEYHKILLFLKETKIKCVICKKEMPLSSSPNPTCSYSCKEKMRGARVQESRLKKEQALSVDEIVEFLTHISSEFTCLGFSKKKSFLIRLKCKLCGRILLLYPTKEKLLKKKRCACPESFKLLRSELDRIKYKGRYAKFIESLSDRNIKILDKNPIFKMSSVLNVSCNKCGFTWSSRVDTLRRMKCPVCNKKSRHGKFKATSLANYGVEHPSQSKEVFAKMMKSGYKYKEYVLNGKTVLVQGYEPQALNYLINEKRIDPKKIQCGLNNSKIPLISYIKNGRTCIYHPDIFIPSLNHIFEVKSTHTFNVDYEINYKKAAACISQGYKFTFLVMSGDGRKLNGMPGFERGKRENHIH